MGMLWITLGCTVCGEGTSNVDGVCVPDGADDTASADDTDSTDDTGTDSQDTGPGHATFTGTHTLPEGAITIRGGLDGEYFGVNLQVEDVTGDGQVDLIVASAQYADTVGRVAVFEGPITGDLAFSDATQVLEGTGTRMRAGRRLAVVNGTLVISQEDWQDTPESVWLVNGTGSGTVDQAAGALTPLEVGGGAGWAFASGGDATGDGVEDLLVGAATQDGSFRGVFVLSGPQPGDALLTADARIASPAGQVAGLGDVDGDGVDDIAVGDTTAHNPDGDPVGAIRVFLGPISGDLSVEDAAYTLYGGSMSSEYADANTVIPIGDVDGDGHADVGAMEPYRRYDDEQRFGVFYAVSGGSLLPQGAVSMATLVVYGGTDSGAPLVSAAGDLDGDDKDDLLIGNPGHEGLGFYTGATWLVPGGSTGSGYEADFAQAEWQGGNREWSVGQAQAAGDLTGDGTVDVILVGPGDGAGAVFLLAGE